MDAGFWLLASLFNGQPFRRLVIPGAIVGIIYWLAHLEDWRGYEVGGIAFFQAVVLTTGLCLVAGQFQLAIIISSAFAVGLDMTGQAQSCVRGSDLLLVEHR